MRAKRRLAESGHARRPVDPETDDFQHIMECRENDCWYCNGRQEDRTIVDRFIEKHDKLLDEAA
jgi:hypothetical protein